MEIVLNYSAAEIDAAIGKIGNLIEILGGRLNIVQLKNDSDNIYPLTKAEAVFFNNNINENLSDKIDLLEKGNLQNIFTQFKSFIAFNATKPTPASSGRYIFDTNGLCTMFSAESQYVSAGDSLIVTKSENSYNYFYYPKNGGNLVDNLNTISKDMNATCFGAAIGVPNSNSSWFVTHKNSNINQNSAYQEAIAYNITLTIYKRMKINGTWGSWLDVSPGSYYKKTETYNRTEIADLLSALHNFKPKVVTSISEVNNSSYIYLILDSKSSPNNIYNEYLYINGKAELVGSVTTTVDLSNYVTSAQLTTALGNYVTSTIFNSAISNLADIYIQKKEYISVPLNVSSNTFTIDYNNQTNSIIDLGLEIPNITYLNIINVPINETGEILIKQSGNKVLIPDNSLIQELELPIQANKISVIHYINVGNNIYLYQDKIISDIYYNGPLAIDTLTLDSFDGINLTMKWVEPYSQSPDDTNITGYDIRYSNSPITTDVGWLNANKLNINPTINGGGLENTISLKLKAGTEYYIYFKTYKNYRNSYYLSPISNVINVVSKSYTDVVVGEPKMLPLDIESCYAKLNKYQSTNGVLQDMSFLFDKEYESISDNDERPLTSVKILGATKWEPQKYWEDGLPYYAIFDLQDVVTIDSIYLYSKDKVNLKVYGSYLSSSEWDYLGDIVISYNDWGFVSLASLEVKDYKYIKLSWENHYYASNNTEDEGSKCWSTSKEFEGELATYSFFGVYGYPKTTKPLTIKQPLRDYSIKHTIGDSTNVNGHFYQDGRIHSMVGGMYPRLFGSYGHFDAQISLNESRYNTISEFKFKTEDIGWVSGNCSNWDYTLVDLLEKTYKPYGMKPILTASTKLPSLNRKTYVTDELGNKTYTKINSSKFVDQHYFEKDNPPSPLKGINGVMNLLDVTTKAENYKISAKLCYTLAAKYGSTKLNTEEEQLLPIETEGFDREIVISGLDLISGIEAGNEDNATWNGWEGYIQAPEAGAYLSAIYDANNKTLLDENLNLLKGIKDADPNMLVLNPGLVGLDKNYFFHQDTQAKKLRQENSIPLDIYSIHSYSSDSGLDQAVNSTVSRGIPFDMQPVLERYYIDMIKYRNQYAPTKQIWVTEFGFGESGAYDTNSKYAAYSLPGYEKDGYIIPDVHRSEIKAAWTIRSILAASSWGVNAMHYYSTENEGNWFDEGQYGQGGGYEMFEWDKLTDLTPGAKVEAIKPYIVDYARGGFGAMGLFGAILANGGYPILRGTWRYMSFRNRLKDYYFTGFKNVTGKSDLKQACFIHKTENKSAMVIYRVGNTNSCYTNIYVDIPSGTTNVKYVKQYIPKLPDPRTVPYSATFGIDQARTGLPTSIREYDENNKVISATFPTYEENPYFPIVGAVKTFGISSYFSGSSIGYNLIGANQYLKPSTEIGVSAALAYRQVDALCDYIDFHPEGIKGANGELIDVNISQNKIKINVVTELPEIYLFENGIIESSFESYVEDLSAVAQNTNSVKLYWNNTNAKDQSYDIYSSIYPDGGYTLYTNIIAGLTNECLISGLTPSTTYYFKMQPKYNNQLGTISDYVSMRTFDYIQTPENFTTAGLSINSIIIAFNSEYETSTDNTFLNYTIERRTQDGTTTIITLTDKTKTSYIDESLVTGSTYTYRMKVVTYGGSSQWTAYSTTRTLTPEEANPSFLSGETDKIINVIRVIFDIELDPIITSNTLNSFSLTENGNSRVLTNISVDTNNRKILLLTYYPDSLSTFDTNLPLKLNYIKPINGVDQLKSIYNNAVNSFLNVIIKNNFGNYNNLIHTYNVNFTNQTNTNINDGWNKILPNGKYVSTLLKDSYDYENTVKLDILNGNETINSVVYRWSLGNNTYTNGLYNSNLYDVPQDVYSTYGNVAYQAINDRLYYSSLKLTGLNDNNRYNLVLYSSKPVTGTNTAYLSFNVNGVESGLFNYAGNTDKFVTFNDITPINGEIKIKMYNEGSTVGSATPINFLKVLEFEDGTQPDTDTVFIKDLIILNQNI